MGLFSKVTDVVKSVAGGVSDFLGSPLGGAVQDAASGYAAYLASKEGAAQKNVWDKRATKLAYERSRRAYKHRYQWQMEDMDAAGLNPILAYQQGAPGGPTGQAIASSDPAQAAVGGLGALTSARAQRAAAKVQKQQERIISNQVKKVRAEVTNTRQNTRLQQQQIHESTAREMNLLRMREQINAQTEQIRQNINSGRGLEEIGLMDAEFWRSPAGRALRAIDRAGTSINPMRSAIGRN